jgi:hypothetical protein
MLHPPRAAGRGALPVSQATGQKMKRECNGHWEEIPDGFPAVCRNGMTKRQAIFREIQRNNAFTRYATMG